MLQTRPKWKYLLSWLVYWVGVGVLSSVIFAETGAMTGISTTWAQEAGVGLLLDYDPPGSGNVFVYAVTYKSPADRAKVKRGDRLLKVNGQDVTGKSLEEIATIMRGPEGSAATLTLQNPAGEKRDVVLVRKVLKAGPAVALPPPSGVGKSAILTTPEKDLVKKKILNLKTEAQRQRMLQLLEDFKAQKMTKPQFLQAIQSQFP